MTQDQERSECPAVMAKQRSDAERRARQSERLARVLRLLQLVQSRAGPWNAQTIATELECSERTVYRDLQSLAMAGIPCSYDEQCQSYRVFPGVRLPPGNSGQTTSGSQSVLAELAESPEKLAELSLGIIQRVMADAQQLASVLGALQVALRGDQQRTV